MAKVMSIGWRLHPTQPNKTWASPGGAMTPVPWLQWLPVPFISLSNPIELPGETSKNPAAQPRPPRLPLSGARFRRMPSFEASRCNSLRAALVVKNADSPLATRRANGDNRYQVSSSPTAVTPRDNMHDGFDHYRKWLGIRAAERPLNHYQLLGLEPFEDDVETIAHAADQRMTYVRTLAAGDYNEATQKLLNELATAKVCLLSPGKKAAYDRQFRAREVAAATAPRAVVPPRSTTAQRRPTILPPAPAARAPAPAPVVAPRPEADFEPLPVPLMSDLPPTSPSSAQPLLPWAAIAVLLVVIVVAAVGVVNALRKQRGAEPLPSENHPPSVEIVSVEPEMPEAGGSLAIRLTGRDPEDDPIAFEYRTGPNSPWQIATDGRVTLSGLQAGMLSLEVRARDSAGHLSDVKTLTKEVLAAAPPLAVAPFSADQAKRHQETWAKHQGAKIEDPL